MLIISISINLSAYEPYGSHASEKWQIWAYTSAAPDFIGDFATVIGADGSVIREGTNGWRCEAFMPMPENGFKKPHDAAPACSDKNSVTPVILCLIERALNVIIFRVEQLFDLSFFHTISLYLL